MTRVMECGAVIAAGVAWCAPVACAQAGLSGADEVRAVVAEMMSDARARSSLTQAGGRVVTDGGLGIEGADGSSLRFRGEGHFRYLRHADTDEDEGGFQVARMRLAASGTVIDEKLRYKVMGDFSRTNGTFGLLDAWVSYEFAPGWTITGGQFVLKFDREWNTSPMNILTMERSILASAFGLSRSQGVMFTGTGERLRFFGAVSDGAVALNSDYPSPQEADVALTARGELRVGDAPWGQHATQSGMPGGESGGLIGLGVHWQQDGVTRAPAGVDGTVDLFQITADVGFEGDGWSVLGQYTGRYADGNGGSVYDSGLLVQGGVFVTDEWEAYARYAHVLPDDDRGANADDFNAISGGANWYPFDGSRGFVLTGEVIYYPEAQADSSAVFGAPNSRFSILPDGDAGQFVFGVQAQIVF